MNNYYKGRYNNIATCMQLSKKLDAQLYAQVQAYIILLEFANR